MVNESLILRKRQLRVASAASGSFFSPKNIWAVPQARDKVREIMFDLLWHSYNYLDPGGEPFLWLGCCHLIFHLKDVKAISPLVVQARSGKFRNFLLKGSSHCTFTNFNCILASVHWFMMTYVNGQHMYCVVLCNITYSNQKIVKFFMTAVG